MKNKLEILGLLLVVVISAFMILCDGKITSPSTIDIPENPKIKKISDTEVEISWDCDIADLEIIFNIARKVGDANWNIDYAQTYDTFFIDEIPTDDSLVYAYKIKAESDTAGLSSEFSDVVAYFSRRTFPTDLSISLLASDTLDISWKDNCIGEEGYKVEKKVGSGKWIKDYKTLNRNVTSFTDITSFGDTAFYRVFAFSGKSTSDTIEGFILSTFPAPYNLEYKNLAIDKIKLMWGSKATGIGGFKIDKKVGSGTWQIGFATVDANQTWWIDENAEINEILQYRVYVFSNEHFSNYAETGEIDNTFPAPSNLTLSKVDENIVKITWQDNSKGEAGFYIDRKIGMSDWINEYALVDSSETIVIDNISEPCGTFYYRVRAFKGSSYSDYSNEDSTNIRLEVVGNFDTGRDASEIFISEQTNWYAFVADKYNGLSIIDCVNPSLPEGESYNEGGLPDRTLSVFATDKYAYVTTHTGIQSPGCLYIVDIGSLIDISSRDLPDSLKILGNCQTTGIPNDVFVKGIYVYIANGEEGLSIIDVSNPAFPSLVSSISTGNFARKVFVKDNYAYVTGGLGGLDVINVSNSSNLSFAGNYQTSGHINDIDIIDDYAFVANGEEGLLILDISNPASPSRVASCQTEGFAYDLCAKQDVYQDYDFVYLIDKEKGVLVIDVTDTAKPYILGSVKMTTNPLSVSSFYHSSYIFLIDDEGMKIIQVAP